MALKLVPDQAESPEFRVSNHVVEIRTERHQQFVDVTALVAERVRLSGITQGTVTVQTRHTTTAIVVNENEPLLIRDLQDLLERLAPRDAEYRHDDLESRRAPFLPDERRNGHSHARAVMLGASESLCVVDGVPDLGRWQRIFLVELDGAQRRRVSIAVMGLAVPDTFQGRQARSRRGHAELRGVS